MHFRNALLSQMGDEDLAAIGDAMMEVSLQRNDRLVESDQLAESMYFPGTAVVSVVTMMQSGRCVETSTIGRESAPAILGILTEIPSSMRVFTQVAGSAIRIPAEIVRQQAVKNPDFLAILLKSAQLDSYQVELSVACNALHSVQARLARWLLLTQDRVGGESLTLTQDFLAIMLGIQRTTVSSAASALNKLRLINYNRGQITIINRDRLIRTACECYKHDSRIATM